MSPRDRKAPEQRRTELLDAAASVFIARGVDGASMADIAEAAGVVKGLLYHYFSSKEELLAVLKDRYLGRWVEEMESLLGDNRGADEVEQLEGFLRSMYAFHSDKVELHHLLLSAPGAEDEVVEKVRKLLLDLVRRGKRRGTFSVAKPTTAVDFILHGLHGMLVDYLHEGRSTNRFTTDAMSVVRPILGIDG